MKKAKNNMRMAIVYFALFIISIGLIAVFVPSMLGISFSPDENIEYYQSPLCVSYIDVGQGDCSLIQCNGVNILVDGGESTAAGTVANYLNDVEVEKIDCYILTHPHSDHIGASADIIKRFPVDRVMLTHFSEFNMPTTNTYENVLDAIGESNAELVEVKAGDSFKFGDLQLDIIAPFEESDDYNEMSIVFSAVYKDTKLLFSGDTTKKIEKQILADGFDVDCDVLKVAHHGSSTSSSAEFVDAVSPELAVVSCGAGNSYGHPHFEIVDLYVNRNITLMRTDEAGTIIYYGDGKLMKSGTVG